MARALLLEQSTSDTYKDEGFTAFINELVKGNVLLMIGKAFEINSNEFDDCNYCNDSNVSLYGWLLKALNNTYHTDAISFSDLATDKKFIRKDDNERCEIHMELTSAINRAELSINDVSPRLIKLLETGYFKFVFTTSFDPLVEIAMRKQWGDIRVKNIYDEDPENQDIENERDLNVPTLYYLFGKAEKNTFVATDIDALDAVRRWLQRSASSTLLRETSRRHILTLGCDHDDWLFRIIWFILKGEGNKLKDGYVAQYSNDKSLERFLIRNKILINNNSSEVVDAIVKELDKREETKRWKDPNHCDVFISYSRKDGQIAEELYKSLKRKGIDTWYDRINLAGRGERFMNTILNAIQNCKLFVPILTTTISEQKREEHPYRLEWKYAIERDDSLGIDLCMPLVDERYDMKNWNNDKIPKEFPEMDYTQFDKEELDLESFAEKVQKKLLNL